MKKVLLATTALALMAGVAHAEVAVTGDARFGFQKIEGGDTTLERRARIKFSGSGETSNGLTFGASFRSDQNATDGNANNTGNVYISGAFGTLSVGSESSAAEYAVGDLAGVGFTGAGFGNENIFLGTDARTAVVYTYSTDAFSARVSVGETANKAAGNTLRSDSLAMGVTYTTGALTLGLGHEKVGADKHTAVAATYVMGETTLKATYGNMDNATQTGVSVAHTMGAISVAGFYRGVSASGVGNDADYYGVGAAYDLGGGAAAKVGFASNDGKNTMEAGINLSF
jgi:outer membrane protein OmpU